MEAKRSTKKKGRKNFRKNRKRAVAVEEVEAEIETTVEEEIIEEPEEEEEDTFKKDLIDTLATQLQINQEEVLQEYEKFYLTYSEGEISKVIFIEENKVRKDMD